MKLYNLIMKISEIISLEDNSFYEYMIHTSDDNGDSLELDIAGGRKKLKIMQMKQK